MRTPKFVAVGQKYRWPRPCGCHLKWGQSCGTEPFKLWDLMQVVFKGN